MSRSRLAPMLFALLAAWLGTARAQPMLYAQRLPKGTVYVRLANALPSAVSVATGFAGTVELGADGPGRISPYFVAGDAGGRTVALQVTQAGHVAEAAFQPQSGAFVTVVLHADGPGVTASVVVDRPEYNQIKARLSFYNATGDCAGASLSEAAGATVFNAVPPDAARSRSVNPAAATLTAACSSERTAPLTLGQLAPGGLYTVWLMRPSGTLTSFVAHDTIAPPRS